MSLANAVVVKRQNIVAEIKQRIMILKQGDEVHVRGQKKPLTLKDKYKIKGVFYWTVEELKCMIIETNLVKNEYQI